jgi:hypothetical protein
VGKVHEEETSVGSEAGDHEVKEGGRGDSLEDGQGEDVEGQEEEGHEGEEQSGDCKLSGNGGGGFKVSVVGLVEFQGEVEEEQVEVLLDVREGEEEVVHFRK